MDVELSRHLMASQKHASIPAETLELMGREAATALLTKSIPLNESIAKLAGAHPDFSAEQVKRVVESANTAVYLAMHDKNKTAGAGSSYPQFELADAGRIIQNMSSGSKPTVVTQTDLDYASLPTRKDKISSADSDAIIDEMFKTSSKDLGYTKDSVLDEVMAVKQDLVDLSNNLRSTGERFDLLHKEASEDYYQQVKAHLLGDGSFSDVIVAARSTGIDNEKLASAMKPVITRLLKEKIASAERLQEGSTGISKVAHRVVNDAHPLVTSFSAVILSSDEIEKIAVGLDDVETQLKRVQDFIKEEFCAGVSR